MDKANLLKKIVGAISSVLSSMLGILYIPVLLLVTCNVVDYTTGLIAAKYRDDGTISSYKSFRGFLRKFPCGCLQWQVLWLNQLIEYTTDTIGLKFPFQFLIACIVAVWLICNELISILENIKDAGVNIPAFLLPLVKNIKSQTEASVNMENEDKEEQKMAKKITTKRFRASDKKIYTIYRYFASDNTFFCAKGKLKRANVRYIPIHNTGNKGRDTAYANANYFYNNKKVYAGAHFIIDLDGTIYQSGRLSDACYSVGGNKYENCYKTGGGTYFGKMQ